MTNRTYQIESAEPLDMEKLWKYIKSMTDADVQLTLFVEGSTTVKSTYYSRFIRKEPV